MELVSKAQTSAVAVVSTNEVGVSAAACTAESRPTVVIAGAESVTGMNAGRALAGKGIRRVGVSANLDAPPSRTRLWDQLVYSPAGDENWIDTLEELGARLLLGPGAGDTRPALLLSSDALVLAVAAERERLSSFYRIVLPSDEALHRLMDKTRFQDWAIAQGFSIPASRIVDTPTMLDAALDAMPYPLILKPLVRTPAWDARFANDKLFVLQSRRTAYPSAAELLALSPRLLVQQWIPGGDEDVLFCLAYADKRDGRVLASYCGQKWLQWPPGTGSTAICGGLEHPELESLSIRLLEQAGLRGLGSVEVKRSPNDGRLYLTEPTVGRNDFQSYLAVAGGVNLTWLAVCDALDLPRPHLTGTARAIWIDEFGMLQSARAQRAWRPLLVRVVRRRPLRVTCALWSPRDPSPALARVRSVLSGRQSTVAVSQLGPRAHQTGIAATIAGDAGLSVTVGSGDAITELREEWQELHAQSDADPLFMSWAWHSSWWETYAAACQLEAAIFAVRDARGRLVGLAPFSRRTALVRGLRVRSLEVIGNVWRHAGPMRSEYLDLVMAPSERAETMFAVLKAVDADGDWEQFVWSDLDLESPTYDALRSGMVRHAYLRTPWRDRGFRIRTTCSFVDYLQSLSGAARRRVYLQRSKLRAKGAIVLREYPFARFTEFAVRLDRLHALRWGRPFFVGRMRRFHERLVARLDGSGRSRMSVLEVGGEPVSALYNIEVGGREYNLQGGFDARFCPGVSLAKLHLGYAIEQACARDTCSLELLVGGGRIDDFKPEFSDEVCTVVTVQILRSRPLALAHQIADWLRPTAS